jgi:hypothetical protein
LLLEQLTNDCAIEFGNGGGNDGWLGGVGHDQGCYNIHHTSRGWFTYKRPSAKPHEYTVGTPSSKIMQRDDG